MNPPDDVMKTINQLFPPSDGAADRATGPSPSAAKFGFKPSAASAAKGEQRDFRKVLEKVGKDTHRAPQSDRSGQWRTGGGRDRETFEEGFRYAREVNAQGEGTSKAAPLPANPSTTTSHLSVTPGDDAGSLRSVTPQRDEPNSSPALDELVEVAKVAPKRSRFFSGPNEPTKPAETKPEGSEVRKSKSDPIVDILRPSSDVVWNTHTANTSAPTFKDAVSVAPQPASLNQPQLQAVPQLPSQPQSVQLPPQHVQLPPQHVQLLAQPMQLPFHPSTVAPQLLPTPQHSMSLPNYGSQPGPMPIPRAVSNVPAKVVVGIPPGQSRSKNPPRVITAADLERQLLNGNAPAASTLATPPHIHATTVHTQPPPPPHAQPNLAPAPQAPASNGATGPIQAHILETQLLQGPQTKPTAQPNAPHVMLNPHPQGSIVVSSQPGPAALPKSPPQVWATPNVHPAATLAQQPMQYQFGPTFMYPNPAQQQFVVLPQMYYPTQPHQQATQQRQGR